MASGKETKNLKSKLDGDQLDLSLSDLSVVPVREIAALKKVTDLDLSSNQILTLSDEFCTLKSLVRLDLSSNKLRSLPEQFGKLENLQHLDLYKNNLETLPLSFCHLKQLRWLDVKDNQLGDNLRKVAGDCLDPKQCKEAATRVVQYMQKVNAEKERDRQKELKKQRELETAEKIKAENQMVKANEKKKERRKEIKNAREELMQQKKEKVNDGSKLQARNNERGTAKATKNPKNKKSRGILGCIGCLCSFLFFLLSLVVFLALVLSIGLYANCSRPTGKEFIPKSRPLCQDIYQVLQTGRFSAASMTWDAKATFQESGQVLGRLSNHVVEGAKQFDYIRWRDAIVEFVLTCRDTIIHFCAWTYENGSEIAMPLLKQMVEWFWIALAFVTWALEHAFQYAIRAMKWTTDLVVDVVNNFPAYWEKAKYYWNNLK